MSVLMLFFGVLVGWLFHHAVTQPRGRRWEWIMWGCLVIAVAVTILMMAPRDTHDVTIRAPAPPAHADPI